MSQHSAVIAPYVNGRFVTLTKPEKLFHAHNPCRPGDVLAVTGWSRDLVTGIIEGMQRAQQAFALAPWELRLVTVQKIIHSIRDAEQELKSQMMLELGRTKQAVDEEWRLCESVFQCLEGFCRRVLSEKEHGHGWAWQYGPVGLVLVSSNVALPVYSLLAAALPALVAGNAVALKPSVHTPLSSSLLASCVHQAGIPAGLVQMIYGDLDVYRRLLLTHQFDAILYTGGEESVEQIRRDLSHQQKTRMVFCSAGKNAALLLKGCHVQDAIARVLFGAFVDCGQRLESTGLVFVQREIYHEFIDGFVKAVKNMPIGFAGTPGEDSRGYFMGPLCSATSRERYLRFQGIAARESLETLRWGKSIDNAGNGFFVSPGVHVMNLEQVKRSIYASNPSFGPDVCVVPIDDAKEAVAVLDSLETSRVLAVYSGHEEEVKQMRQCSQVPTVCWNCPTTDLAPEIPALGRGRAGNNALSGLHFVYATVFPKTLNFVESFARKGTLFTAIFCFFVTLFFAVTTAQAQYRKAVEGNEVVKSKLYPRSGKIQINALQVGTVLNQSFVNTMLINLGVTYHFNEWHAVNVEGFFGISSENDARKCVESFYFDPERAQRAGSGGVCSEDADPTYTDAQEPQAPAGEAYVGGPYHRKPAYMAIRQIDQMFGINYQWTPVYGKQLILLSATSYLDVYFNAGLGLAMSTYWPKKTTINRGSTTVDIPSEGTAVVGEFGKAGRPEAQKQTSPVLSLGIGNRFFFARNFLVNFEFRNNTVFGGNGAGGSDIMNFFALWGGLGIMF